MLLVVASCWYVMAGLHYDSGEVCNEYSTMVVTCILLALSMALNLQFSDWLVS